MKCSQFVVQDDVEFVSPLHPLWMSTPEKVHMVLSWLMASGAPVIVELVVIPVDLFASR